MISCSLPWEGTMQKLIVGAALAVLVFQPHPGFAQAQVAVADPTLGSMTCATPESRGACEDEATRTRKLFELWGSGFIPSKEFLAQQAENRRLAEEARLRVEGERRFTAEDASIMLHTQESCTAK